MLRQPKKWLIVAVVPTLFAAIAANSWAQYPVETTEKLSKQVEIRKPSPVDEGTAEKDISNEEQPAVKPAAGDVVTTDQRTGNTGDEQQTGIEEADAELAISENPQNTRDLEQQYLKLRQSIETEDAFSERLGEDYLDYGMLLRESGQYKEAIKAFVDALHISKVNNGIYGIEQRPALVALFETHLILDNQNDYEEAIQRLLWIEEKNPGSASETSFKLQLLLGNQYLDDFFSRPIRGQESVDKLLMAKRHLASAMRIHGNRPLTELMMPYGELALISYFESTILPNVDSRTTYTDPMFKSMRRIAPGGDPGAPVYFTDSYPRGMAYLNRYLQKAQKENNQEHIVHALLSLGDYQQLFKKNRRSEPFYKQAWEEAQKLPAEHELRKKFEEPIPLPNFNYAYPRTIVLPQRETVEIPLTLKINQYGRVQDVADWNGALEKPQEYSRARRVVRHKIFRPQIVAGESIGTENHEFRIRVYKNR